MKTEIILIQLLNIAIHFDEIKLPDDIRLIIRCMLIESINLLKVINDQKVNYIEISILIDDFYKRFHLKKVHFAISDMNYQKSLIMKPLIFNYRNFHDKFYNIRHMLLNRIDNYIGENIDDMELNEEEMEIINNI